MAQALVDMMTPADRKRFDAMHRCVAANDSTRLRQMFHTSAPASSWWFGASEPTYPTNWLQEYVLPYAAQIGANQILQYLAEIPWDVHLDALWKNMFTALMHATWYRQLGSVQLLQQNGCDLDIINPHSGYTALMYAAEKGDLDIVMFLHHHGAGIHYRRHVDGKTAAMLASDRAVKQFLTAGDGGRALLDITKFTNTLNKITNLSPTYKNIKLATSEIKSASHSIRLTATLSDEKTQVFLKVTPALPSNIRTDNSTFVEQAIYITLAKQLLEQMITPHVIPGMAILLCDAFTLSTTDAAIQAAFAAIPTRVDDRAKILVTPFVHGKSLYTWFTTKSHSDNEIRSIMFQLIYTLHVFQLNNLRHNDLHFDNILVEPCHTVYYYYDIDNTHYKVPTYGSCIRIFDFDQAAHAYINTHNQNELCLEHGICNAVNPHYDLFYVLSIFCSLSRTICRSIIYSTLNRTNQNALNAMVSSTLCNRLEMDPSRCYGDYLLPSNLYTPLDFIQACQEFNTFQPNAGRRLLEQNSQRDEAVWYRAKRIR